MKIVLCLIYMTMLIVLWPKKKLWMQVNISEMICYNSTLKWGKWWPKFITWQRLNTFHEQIYSLTDAGEDTHEQIGCRKESKKSHTAIKENSDKKGNFWRSVAVKSNGNWEFESRETDQDWNEVKKVRSSDTAIRGKRKTLRANRCSKAINCDNFQGIDQMNCLILQGMKCEEVRSYVTSDEEEGEETKERHR